VHGKVMVKLHVTQSLIIGCLARATSHLIHIDIMPLAVIIRIRIFSHSGAWFVKLQ